MMNSIKFVRNPVDIRRYNQTANDIRKYNQTSTEQTQKKPIKFD